MAPNEYLPLKSVFFCFSSLSCSITPFLGSNDLGNSLAGNDRIGPLLKRLDELETYLDPLFAEKEACSLGVKLSLAESEFETVKANQGMLGEQYL